MRDELCAHTEHVQLPYAPTQTLSGVTRMSRTSDRLQMPVWAALLQHGYSA